MKVIRSVLEERKEDARKLLLEAADEGFEQVYVVGFKNKMAYLKGSKIESNMEAIGALEMCKLQIFANS